MGHQGHAMVLEEERPRESAAPGGPAEAPTSAAAGARNDRDVMGRLESLEGSGGSEISDSVADKLLQTLSLLETNYERTVAAGSGRGRGPAHEAEEGGGEDAEWEEEEFADGAFAPAGYAALGSDDEGSEGAVETWLGAEGPAGEDGGRPDAPGEAAAAPLGGAAARPRDARVPAGGEEFADLGRNTAAPPPPLGGGAGADLADGGEDFADFGRNAAAPPPPGPSALSSGSKERPAHQGGDGAAEPQAAGVGSADLRPRPPAHDQEGGRRRPVSRRAARVTWRAPSPLRAEQGSPAPQPRSGAWPVWERRLAAQSRGRRRASALELRGRRP
ncbi:unnamed protein product [Prorocentrum cordatum]|uniref:Centrosomal protein of 19 kDa n=1 Tax=Prorocentrum cordatum TaxID=2364126 RepID=A0ABN9SN09_9DINO|nr:unnamed protein product [Polarella glacialis]